MPAFANARAAPTRGGKGDREANIFRYRKPAAFEVRAQLDRRRSQPALARVVSILLPGFSFHSGFSFHAPRRVLPSSFKRFDGTPIDPVPAPQRRLGNWLSSPRLCGGQGLPNQVGRHGRRPALTTARHPLRLSPHRPGAPASSPCIFCPFRRPRASSVPR